MKTIGCETAMAGLSAWMDGELVGEDAEALAAHVVGCAACQRRRSLLAAVGEAVRALPAETVSAGFDEGLRRRTTRRGRPGRSVALFAAGLAAAWWVTPRDATRLEPPAVVQTTPIAVRTAGALAVDCGLGPSAGRCRVETPCTSAAECGPALTPVWSPTARHAPSAAGGWPAAGIR